MHRKTSVSQAAAKEDPPSIDWIDGKAAASVLDWENTNSVRNAAREGRFGPRGEGWTKLGNGRIRYNRSAVEAYARRDRGAQLPSTSVAS